MTSAVIKSANSINQILPSNESKVTIVQDYKTAFQIISNASTGWEKQFARIFEVNFQDEKTVCMSYVNKKWRILNPDPPVTPECAESIKNVQEFDSINDTDIAMYSFDRYTGELKKIASFPFAIIPLQKKEK